MWRCAVCAALRRTASRGASASRLRSFTTPILQAHALRTSQTHRQQQHQQQPIAGFSGLGHGNAAAAAALRNRRALSTAAADAAEQNEPTPPPAPPGEQYEFQAETRQLLDIVTHSLYTDKEVFLRELISNASDAMEKLRQLQGMGEALQTEGSLPAEIRITTDEAAKTVTLVDSGVGMTREELVSNLGTIARSGSKVHLYLLVGFPCVISEAESNFL